jgi:hypothetical protein
MRGGAQITELRDLPEMPGSCPWNTISRGRRDGENSSTAQQTAYSALGTAVLRTTPGANLPPYSWNSGKRFSV